MQYTYNKYTEYNIVIAVHYINIIVLSYLPILIKPLSIV